MEKHGYTQAQCDHTLFKKSQDEKILVLLVYVGDILLTRDDTTKGDIMKKVLAKEFEIKDLGPMKYFLGMEVARSKKGIYVSQRKYIIDFLGETSFLESKPTHTPIEENHKLGYKKGEVPVDKGRY